MKLRYSVLIPAYQNATTIKRCLDSILNQKGNYEVIIINDGSTDNLEDVLEDYKGKISYYKQKNKGVAVTRNELIKKAKGDYLLFVDADDYIKCDFFESMDKILNKYKDIDIVSFGIELVDRYLKNVSYMLKPSSNGIISGEELFVKYVSAGSTFETPVGYVYRKSYFIDNKFQYSGGHNHEDYGLTPLVLVYAKKTISLNDSFYCYVQTESSITRGCDSFKLKKNAYDMLYHFYNLKSKIDNDNKLSDITKKYFYSFLANSLLIKVKTLSGKDYVEFKQEIKKRKISSMLLDDTMKRKIKKFLVMMKY